MKPQNGRQNFIDNLPAGSAIIPLRNIVWTLLIGVVLSFVFVLSLNPIVLSLPDNFRYFAGVIIQDLPVVGLFTWLYFRYKKAQSTLQVNASPANKKSTVLITTLSFMVLFLTIFFGLYITLKISHERPNYSTMTSYYESDINIKYILTSILGLLFYFVLAFFEEFVFRYMIYRNLRRKGMIYALVISSLVFSVMHMNIGIPFSFLAGIVFALNYEYTNSLLATVVLHAVHNYLSFFYASYLVVKLLA